MIVEETTDIEEIKKVLCTPEIYECIADDSSGNACDYNPPMDATYIAGYVDGDIIGLMIYHTFTGKFKAHIQVLPEYRKEHAREFARIALKFGEAKNAVIYAEIPECYPNVLKFAKSFGFEETGSIKDEYTKHCIQYDVIKLRLDNELR